MLYPSVGFGNGQALCFLRNKKREHFNFVACERLIADGARSFAIEFFFTKVLLLS